MPDPKKKPRVTPKKVVTNRKTGKVTVNKTPVRRMTMVEKTNGGMSPATKIIKKPVKKVLTPAQKAKLLALKKLEERKKISAGKPRVKATPKKKKLSPGERERAARIARRLAVKARIKRNSGN